MPVRRERIQGTGPMGTQVDGWMEGERCAGGGVEQMNGELCRKQSRAEVGNGWVRRRQRSEGALESFPSQFAFIVSSFTSTTLRLC